MFFTTLSMAFVPWLEAFRGRPWSQGSCLRNNSGFHFELELREINLWSDIVAHCSQYVYISILITACIRLPHDRQSQSTGVLMSYFLWCHMLWKPCPLILPDIWVIREAFMYAQEHHGKYPVDSRQRVRSLCCILQPTKILFRELGQSLGNLRLSIRIQSKLGMLPSTTVN